MKALCKVADCHRPSRSRGWCKNHYYRWHKHGDPLAGGTSDGVPLAWLEKHKNFAGDECLYWPFVRNPGGYGQIRQGEKKLYVHRVICAHRHGPPPTPQHEAAHSCGNGHLGCVNGQHLNWKTPKGNQADTLTHGTRNRGERHGAAKLAESDVRDIRAATGHSRKELAAHYGVDIATIGQIIRKTTWAWLS